MNHKWKLSQQDGPITNLKYYYCDRCKIGPIRIRILNTKQSITKTAKSQGYSSDCNEEIVRSILES